MTWTTKQANELRARICDDAAVVPINKNAARMLLNSHDRALSILRRIDDGELHAQDIRDFIEGYDQ